MFKSKIFWIGMIILCAGLIVGNIYRIGMKSQKDHPQNEWKVAPTPKEFSDTVKRTDVQLLEQEYDFGTIEDGAVVSHEFKVINVGNAPLFIKEVIVSCGCTVPEFTRTPILPNDTGSVMLTFDSKGKVGNVDKSVMMICNALNDRIPLTFKAKVVESKK